MPGVVEEIKGGLSMTTMHPWIAEARQTGYVGYKSFGKKIQQKLLLIQIFNIVCYIYCKKSC